jgi:prepilin-type N-terminal cleavage/methylation domain-containing protein
VVKGFTLIEVLVVIIVIVFLVAGLALLVSGLIDRAKTDKTQGLIQMVVTGCKAYRSEFREWPPTQPYAGSANLHYYLGREYMHEVQGSSTRTGGAPGVQKKHRPFVEFEVDWLKGAASSEPNPPVPLMDSWGQTLTYEVLANGDIRIVSAGPDGILGNEDDISSEVRPN